MLLGVMFIVHNVNFERVGHLCKSNGVAGEGEICSITAEGMIEPYDQLARSCLMGISFVPP